MPTSGNAADNNRAAAPSEHKPKRSEEFCSRPLVETKLIHNALLIIAILGRVASTGTCNS